MKVRATVQLTQMLEFCNHLSMISNSKQLDGEENCQKFQKIKNVSKFGCLGGEKDLGLRTSILSSGSHLDNWGKTWGYDRTST
jgi:hypothetical protein